MNCREPEIDFDQIAGDAGVFMKRKRKKPRDKPKKGY